MRSGSPLKIIPAILLLMPWLSSLAQRPPTEQPIAVVGKVKGQVTYSVEAAPAMRAKEGLVLGKVGKDIVLVTGKSSQADLYLGRDGLALHLPQLTEVSVETHENEGLLNTTFRLNKGSLIGLVGRKDNIPGYAIIASTNFIFYARADAAFEVKPKGSARLFAGTAMISSAALPPSRGSLLSFPLTANTCFESNMITRASADIPKDIQKILSDLKESLKKRSTLLKN